MGEEQYAEMIAALPNSIELSRNAKKEYSYSFKVRFGDSESNESVTKKLKNLDNQVRKALGESPFP
jgi:hypothetical protein